MAIPVDIELRATITEFLAKMDEAKHKVGEVGDHGAAMGSKLGSALSTGLLAVGGAAVAVGVMSIKAASEYQDAHVSLVTAIGASGRKFADYSKQIEEHSTQMRKLGFTDTDVEKAMTSMTIALQDPNKAMKDLTLAADIARARHIDLTDAAMLVTKAEEGNIKALKQMGIDLPVVASSSEKVKVANENLAKATDNLNTFLTAHPTAVNASSKAHAEYEKKLTAVNAAQDKLNNLSSTGGAVIDALTQRFGGQASAQANTFAGKLQAVNAEWDHMKQKIGEAVLPALTKVVDYTVNSAIPAVAGWVTQLTTAGQTIDEYGNITGKSRGKIDDFSAASGSAMIKTRRFWDKHEYPGFEWMGQELVKNIALTGQLVEISMGLDTVFGGLAIQAATFTGVLLQGLVRLTGPLASIGQSIGHAINPFDGPPGIPAYLLPGPAGDKARADIKRGLNPAYTSPGGMGGGMYGSPEGVTAFPGVNPATGGAGGTYGPAAPAYGARYGGAGGAFAPSASGAMYGGAAGMFAHYASGGTVPGAIGAPQFAVVHGGETIVPAGGGGGSGVTVINNYFTIQGNIVDQGRFAEEIRRAMIVNGRSLTTLGFN